MLEKMALHKIRGEKIWSATLIILLTMGLAAWTIIPSISASLQAALSTYGNGVSTYMFIYNTGRDHYLSRLGANVIDKIVTIPGVQEVYPIVSNITNFIDNTTVLTLPDGTRLSTGAIIGYQSAVIGEKGFPESLICLSAGRLPIDEACFVFNGLASLDFKLNNSRVVLLPTLEQIGVSDSNYFYDNDTQQEYLRFNATAVGQMPYNPMLQQIMVLWNSTFILHKLGPTVYNETFGGDGANFFVVKAYDIRNVQQIAESLQSIFANYTSYSVVYDQAGVNAQISFQSGTNSLYIIIAICSLFFVISLIFLLTYVFIHRRSWEIGLLLSQGWSWHKVTEFFSYYYFNIGIFAIAISTPVCLLIGSQLHFSFQAYNNTLNIPVLISPYLLGSAVIISVVASALTARFAVWRMKKMGLDNLLREC